MPGTAYRSLSKLVTPDQLRRRKRVQARLATTGALIGLGALGARGGGAIAARRGASGARLAHRLDSATTNALTIGAGVGGVAGLNSAAISRTEGRQKATKTGVVKSAFGIDHEIVKFESWDAKKHPRGQRGRFALHPGQGGAAEKVKESKKKPAEMTREERVRHYESKKYVGFRSGLQPAKRPRGKLKDLPPEELALYRREQQQHKRKEVAQAWTVLGAYGGTTALFLLYPSGRRLFTAYSTRGAGAAGAMAPRAFGGFNAGRALTGSAAAKVTDALASPAAAKQVAHDMATMTDADSRAVSHWFAPNGVTQFTINSARGGQPNRQARLVTQLLAHADHADTPQLVRGMKGVTAHKSGDVVDFGPMASFTEDFDIAHNWVRKSLARSNQIHAVYLLEQGTAPAVRIDQSMRMNPMHEWLVGGKHVITGSHLLPSKTSSAPVRMFTIRPATPADLK